MFDFSFPLIKIKHRIVAPDADLFRRLKNIASSKVSFRVSLAHIQFAGDRAPCLSTPLAQVDPTEDRQSEDSGDLRLDEVGGPGCSGLSAGSTGC